MNWPEAIFYIFLIIFGSTIVLPTVVVLGLILLDMVFPF